MPKNMYSIYSKEGCPFCEKIERVMVLSDLTHRVYKLDSDFTREQFYAEFGEGSTFPQVVVDDVHLGGCNDTIKYLKENNIV